MTSCLPQHMGIFHQNLYPWKLHDESCRLKITFSSFITFQSLPISSQAIMKRWNLNIFSSNSHSNRIFFPFSFHFLYHAIDSTFASKFSLSFVELFLDLWVCSLVSATNWLVEFHSDEKWSSLIEILNWIIRFIN